MTLDTWLNNTQNRLTDSGLVTGRLDALILLEDALGIDRARLLAHPETEFSEPQLAILNEQVARRMRHVPLAYIRGRTEFYGRTFTVNQYVLEPRPESEMLIDIFKFLPGADSMTVADIGTGSGALAITIKLDLPGTTVYAVDIDDNCLDVARRNAARLSADITEMQGDLLRPLINHQLSVDALICNLPYVPDDYQINTAASHEPRSAIFGGADGLELYKLLFTQTLQLPVRPRYILTESMPPQHAALAAIAAASGYTIQKMEDFVQVFHLT